MDEQQIANKLASNIPQEPVTQVVPMASDPVGETGYVDNMPFDELTKYKLSEHFQIPQHMQSDPEVVEKLSLVYGWAATIAGSEDYLAIQTFLHSIDGTMGLGGNQSRLDRFYHFAKLDLQRRRIEQEMQNASWR